MRMYVVKLGPKSKMHLVEKTCVELFVTKLVECIQVSSLRRKVGPDLECCE